jgi:hypothetical protein
LTIGWSSFWATFSKPHLVTLLVLPKPIHIRKIALGAGLPDGLVSNQKSQFGYILEGLRLENVDIFYGYFEYFRDI